MYRDRDIWLQVSLRWRHNGHDIVSNHQPRDCFLNRLFRHRSKKTSKLRVTGLWVGNSPGTGEFPAQMASNAENVSISWRHHVEDLILAASEHKSWFLLLASQKKIKTVWIACSQFLLIIGWWNNDVYRGHVAKLRQKQFWCINIVDASKLFFAWAWNKCIYIIVSL